ncbi:MAG: hypothetical protein RQ875_00705 [Vicingaceae bacterium]|nr:hypothetical protein [Vicingaceae bacterium]
MKNFLLIFFLIASVIVSAQKNVTVKWGPTYKTPPKSSSSSIIGDDGTHFYIVRGGKGYRGGVFLEKYNKQMKLVYSKELVIPKKGDELLTYESIILLNNSPVLLASFNDRKSNKSYAFAYPIDENGKVGSKFKLLDERETDGKKFLNMDFVLSKDSTKLLFYYSPTYDKYADEKFSYKVFDNSLNILWEKDVKLPYRDKNFGIKDYVVDNEGNVFMLSTIYPDKSKGEKETKHEQAKTYTILAYKYKEATFKQYEIKLKNKWVSDIYYDLNEEKGELYVGGFYSDDRYTSSTNGIFYMSINIKTTNVTQSSTKAFDKDFMIDELGERKADKGKGITSYVFDYFYAKKDGGAYLIAEKYYVTVHTTTNPQTGATTTRYVYHYNDIIVVNVNPKGEIEWIRKVPKRSSDGAGGYYLSYAINFNTSTNNLNIIFNDNPANIEILKTNEKKIKAVNIKKSVATVVNINEEGYLKRVPLFKNKENDKIILQPKKFMQIDDNTLIIYGVRGKEYKFGNISIN